MNSSLSGSISSSSSDGWRNGVGVLRAALLVRLAFCRLEVVTMLGKDVSVGRGELDCGGRVKERDVATGVVE